MTTKRPTWEQGTEAPAASLRQSYRLQSLDGLRSLMVARGYTSGYSLAKDAGIGVSALNHIVHGRRDTATPHTVAKLRETLGRDIDSLFVLDKSTIRMDHGRAA